ncbi:MAG: glycosyltransferase [Desulfobacteraceae bacterium]|nr:MAG: glycosyltransferase [Desulfobacteraceae bacterium]
MTNTINLFGYSISNQGVLKDVVHALKTMDTSQKPFYMACVNPHSIVTAKKDPVFRKSLKTANLLIPDGIGIVWSSRFLNIPLEEKVAGSDFFSVFNKLAAQKTNLKYFFLGSNEVVLNLIRQRMARDFPSIDLCGTYSPPYKDEFDDGDNIKMVEAVNKAKPDVLWVGMTAPKQEKWIYVNHHQLDVPFIGAIGAVFDFFAGTKKRPSEFWIRIGLEWMPRFLKEPGRLWERNLKSSPIYIMWIIREKLRRSIQQGVQ